MDQVEDIVEKHKGVYWFAFITDLTKNEQSVIGHKHQKELKRMLSELENIEVHFIVKGRSYAFKVQKSFSFGSKK